MRPDPKKPSFTTIKSLSFSEDSRWTKASGDFARGDYVWDLNAEQPQPLDAKEIPASAVFPTEDRWVTNSGDKIELYRHKHDAQDSEQTPENESPTEIIKIQTQGLWPNSIQMDPDRIGC